MTPSPTGEAERLVAWLEERGLAVRTHPALRDGVPVLVVRSEMPGLRRAGLDRDELWRFVAVMAGVALFLAVLLPVLSTWRDARSEGRAEEAASLLASAVARERAAGGEVDEARASSLMGEVVPRETREMRSRYARGDLQVGWLVVPSPEAGGSAPGQAALCVETRSLAGDEVYAAAWAVGEEVSRTRRGVGCGTTPGTWEDALARATD